MVFYHHSNTLLPCVPFATVVALPTELPLRQAQFHRCITNPTYYRGIKTGYFYLLFGAWDCPTVASIDPNSSAAYIAALRSRGF